MMLDLPTRRIQIIAIDAVLDAYQTLLYDNVSSLSTPQKHSMTRFALTSASVSESIYIYAVSKAFYQVLNLPDLVVPFTHHSEPELCYHVDQTLSLTEQLKPPMYQSILQAGFAIPMLQNLTPQILVCKDHLVLTHHPGGL